MKILIISDIHANLDALQAVFSAAGGECDGLLCLGDITGYGSDPSECVALLKRSSRDFGYCRMLSGNHDAVLWGRLGESWFNPGVLPSIAYTRARLGKDDIGWLASLPSSFLSPADGTIGTAYLAVHGSPQEPLTGYLWGGGETVDSLAYLAVQDIPVCCSGHTHVVSVFSRPGYNPFLPDGSVTVAGSEPVIVNPGGLGFPRSHGVFSGESDALGDLDMEPEAAGKKSGPSLLITVEAYPAYYAIWDTLAGTVALRSVRYDRRDFDARCAIAGLANS